MSSSRMAKDRQGGDSQTGEAPYKQATDVEVGRSAHPRSPNSLETKPRPATIRLPNTLTKDLSSHIRQTQKTMAVVPSEPPAATASRQRVPSAGELAAARQALPFASGPSSQRSSKQPSMAGRQAGVPSRTASSAGGDGSDAAGPSSVYWTASDDPSSVVSSGAGTVDGVVAETSSSTGVPDGSVDGVVPASTAATSEGGQSDAPARHPPIVLILAPALKSVIDSIQEHRLVMFDSTANPDLHPRLPALFQVHLPNSLHLMGASARSAVRILEILRDGDDSPHPLLPRVHFEGEGGGTTADVSDAKSALEYLRRTTDDDDALLSELQCIVADIKASTHPAPTPDPDDVHHHLPHPHHHHIPSELDPEEDPEVDQAEEVTRLKVAFAMGHLYDAWAGARREVRIVAMRFGHVLERLGATVILASEASGGQVVGFEAPPAGRGRRELGQDVDEMITVTVLGLNDVSAGTDKVREWLRLAMG